jgi:glutamate dehydrogenase
VVDALQNAPHGHAAVIALFLAATIPLSRATAPRPRPPRRKRSAMAWPVGAINDDRLLRQYRALVEAMLRTNAFVPAGAEALAFKLDSSGGPRPAQAVPWREIFVYSPRVEGIHLRAGPVARGGLRWSDRRDDFRTEVLGLMKAQRVKNAVIVPTGAKGGFYPKQLPDPARPRWLAGRRQGQLPDLHPHAAVGHRQYRRRQGRPSPAGVVIRDGEDPYFVVAADKGTATFSDTANAIADGARLLARRCLRQRRLEGL